MVRPKGKNCTWTLQAALLLCEVQNRCFFLSRGFVSNTLPQCNAAVTGSLISIEACLRTDVHMVYRTLLVVRWKTRTVNNSLVPELCPSEGRRLIDGDVAEAQLFTRGYRFRAANLQLVRVAGSEGRASKLTKGQCRGPSAG